MWGANAMKERVIRVKGKGRVSMPPDCIEVSMALEVIHEDYAEAMKVAGRSLEDIRRALQDEGLDREDIRTTSFEVSTRYEHKHDRYRNTQRVFVGYVISNHLKIEIDQDSKRLGRVLGALADCPANPDISIRYKLRDEVAVKEQLLRHAVQDAKAKASVLAESAGVTLGEMLSVDYSWGEIEFRQAAQFSVAEAPPAYAHAMVDLEPDLLEATDTVTIVWAIR